jgi:hypothetical protein
MFVPPEIALYGLFSGNMTEDESEKHTKHYSWQVLHILWNIP